MHVTVKLLLQVVALSEETVLEPLLVVPKYVLCPLMPGDIDWYRLHFQFLYRLLYNVAQLCSLLNCKIFVHS